MEDAFQRLRVRRTTGRLTLPWSSTARTATKRLTRAGRRIE
jgi:hypothetical protein